MAFESLHFQALVIESPPFTVMECQHLQDKRSTSSPSLPLLHTAADPASTRTQRHRYDHPVAPPARRQRGTGWRAVIAAVEQGPPQGRQQFLNSARPDAKALQSSLYSLGFDAGI